MRSELIPYFIKAWIYEGLKLTDSALSSTDYFTFQETDRWGYILMPWNIKFQSSIDLNFP